MRCLIGDPFTPTLALGMTGRLLGCPAGTIVTGWDVLTPI